MNFFSLQFKYQQLSPDSNVTGRREGFGENHLESTQQFDGNAAHY